MIKFFKVKMTMGFLDRERKIRITSENINSQITNEGERIFARACLKNGIQVMARIKVGKSIIDFKVTNPAVGGSGRLVEVTLMQPNLLSKRKKRQIENMKDSGEPFTLLCKPNIRNILKHLQ